MITIAITAASLLLVGGFLSAPALVDKNLNRVYPSKAPAPSARALALHRSLWIADLHADTLLWQRDLNRESHTGHVDLPRLVRGNVALQAFSVVTKTPRHMNIDSNGASTDNITALVIAQGMPAATWNSLVERALYKAGRLRDFANDSHGAFRMIGSRAQLRAFIAARQENPRLTAGWLTLEGKRPAEPPMNS